MEGKNFEQAHSLYSYIPHQNKKLLLYEHEKNDNIRQGQEMWS